MDDFLLHRGDAPLLVSLPHDGTALPEGLAERLTEGARRLPDTDWHVGRLYGFARAMGASVIRPHWSRYVVDLNRPPDDVSLYPGRNTTGLLPLRQFSGEPVYLAGSEPDAAEVPARIDRYWRPYHAALAGELDRLRARFGRVVLWEGHSIRSEVPFLFEGRLPVFNLGTAAGSSCSSALSASLGEVLAAQHAHDHVVDGRFQGGYITRHYGRPAEGVEAVQLELAQRAYMDEASGAFDPARAAAVEPVLRALLAACLRHAGRAPGT